MSPESLRIRIEKILNSIFKKPEAQQSQDTSKFEVDYEGPVEMYGCPDDPDSWDPRKAIQPTADSIKK